MYGLDDQDLAWIIQEVSRFEEIEEVILFGSRAIGSYKKGSDLDLALRGKSVDREIILKLSDLLNETSPSPLFFDVINYQEINNKELRKHIDEVGVSIYNKKTERNAR